MPDGARAASFVGDVEQHVGVAGLVQRAVARQVAAPKLAFHVINSDP